MPVFPGPPASGSPTVVVRAVPNSPDTIPATVDQPAPADIQYGFDMSGVLVGSETVTAYSASLTDLSLRGQPTVALVDGSTLATNTIAQRVRSGVLVPGRAYRLSVQFTPAGSSDVRTFGVGLRCPW